MHGGVVMWMGRVCVRKGEGMLGWQDTAALLLQDWVTRGLSAAAMVEEALLL